ncbi:kinase-like protein [Aspergillus ruber CBS 135680]|uniref:non-specific serine/threonine protein kinase n=1 Tax=Aspergillus ruber (strain CBS 135680) TaxID=1388766 RepID=A0A017S4I1_ASPRC|nr:kinase-like protein [Aspergillus ruber CBS 135680]EYE91055.1 kinase-like protein [Aspergillus ruber CBS 135680]
MVGSSRLTTRLDAYHPVFALDQSSSLLLPQPPPREYKCYYPAKPREIINDHYQLLVKVGRGRHSTVWLARDAKRHVLSLSISERKMALRINNTRNPGIRNRERDIEKHIALQNPSHPGHMFNRSWLESFEVEISEGNHQFLVYKPMLEPLCIFPLRFVNGRSIYSRYLARLDYLRRECKVLHTYLKLDNILLATEDKTFFLNLSKRILPKSPWITNEPITGRSVYRCQMDLDPINVKEVNKMLPKSIDFGLARKLDSGNLFVETIGIYPIQPNHYCDPEVILCYGWDFSVDFWKLGVWRIIERTWLFRQVHETDGCHDIKVDLVGVTVLLSSPPIELLNRSHLMSQSPQGYYDGPFFNDESEFLHESLIPARTLGLAIPSSMEGEEREGFLSFIICMLTWLPEDKGTARESF